MSAEVPNCASLADFEERTQQIRGAAESLAVELPSAGRARSRSPASAPPPAAAAAADLGSAALRGTSLLQRGWADAAVAQEREFLRVSSERFLACCSLAQSLGLVERSAWDSARARADDAFLREVVRRQHAQTDAERERAGRLALDAGRSLHAIRERFRERARDLDERTRIALRLAHVPVERPPAA